MRDLPSLSDAELVREVHTGSDESFDELLNRYESRVYFVAQMVTGDAETAEEVLQEIFINLYRSLQSEEGGEVSTASIIRETVELALGKVEVARKKETVVFKQAIKKSVREASDTAELGIDIASPQELLNNAVSLLSEEYRTVFLLHDVIGYSESDISSILLITPTEVKNRLRESRHMIRHSLHKIVGETNTGQILALVKTDSVRPKSW